jgi:3-hydroxy-9,10-secoandrosta-1,3,5(10)-triene-9,17-dione monooxygenase
MIERASSLRTFLRERQQATEKAGRVLDEVQQKLVAAGFYRLLQPRRFGGYEFDLPTFAEVFTELSRGCPATGWACTFTAGHTHVLAKFDERAQVEAYGRDGEFRAPMAGAPAVLTPVDGGYLVTGGWDYASGIDGATHFIGSAGVAQPGDDGPPQRTLRVLIHRKDFDIVDNWNIMGMQGSGSKRVVATNVFVPAYRTNAAEPFRFSEERDQPGYGVHDNAMYRAGPSVNVLMCEIAAVAVGTGLSALDTYEEILRARTMRGTTTLRTETPEYQRHFGQARALLDTARSALVGTCRDFMEYCRLDVEEGDRFDGLKSQRIVMVEQQVCELASKAVEVLFRSGGSGAARDDHMLARHFRDMATLLTHTTLQFERYWENYARSYFGLAAPAVGDGRA